MTPLLVETLIDVSDELKDIKLLIDLIYKHDEVENKETLSKLMLHSIKQLVTGVSDLVRSQSKKPVDKKLIFNIARDIFNAMPELLRTFENVPECLTNFVEILFLFEFDNLINMVRIKRCSSSSNHIF